jgi:hypothetical protein
MSSQENKKRPSTTSGGKPSGKRSKFDPKNIATPPAKVKLEGAAAKRRSARVIPSSASSASLADDTLLPSTSSVPDPGNKTIITDGSDSDEVFECALQVNAAQAKDMATTAKQKRRANEALLKEVRHTYTHKIRHPYF